MHEQLGRIETGILRVEGYTAETADSVRRVLRAVSAEVTDCPSLLSITKDRPDGARALRVYQRHYRLTLWCEHPGYWHEWPRASYELDPSKEWFAKVSPYLKLMVKTLQIVIPLVGTIAVATLPTEQIETGAARLDVMRTIVDDLPGDTHEALSETNFSETAGQLRQAEGEGLRAIRAIIFDKDPLRSFGGLRRVQAPSGDYLWICENHYREYDPGLPKMS
jgi:hypothetical protein